MIAEEQLTERIIGAAIEVHKELGPGLLESAYEQCLCHELNLRGLLFKRQVRLPVAYKGLNLSCGYYADLVVNERVVLELKCVPKLLAVHSAQLLTNLRCGEYRVGLLLNFHAGVLRNGIVRRVL